MALYWHPYLAELLRQDYGNRLDIEEEVSLGDMPLRANLSQLPIAPESLPLLLVSKGPKERELAAFLVDHFQEYPQHLQWLQELHVQPLPEVLAMKNLTPEQIGLDFEALLDLIGKEQALDLIDQE